MKQNKYIVDYRKFPTEMTKINVFKFDFKNLLKYIIIVLMLSKNYLPLQDQPVYRVSRSDYNRIKEWMAISKQQFHIQPTLSSSFEYFPMNYVISFKKISIDESFIHKHLRTINMVANNGLKIMAGVEDLSKNVYIAKLYEKKGIFCRIDIANRLIQCLEEIILAFYTLDERVPNSSVNYNVVSPSLKNLYLVIHIQLASSEGEIFNLGYIKHCLANRLKQNVLDLQIWRLGQKQKIGHIECSIDTPERLGLSYFLPPNCIIDQFCCVPPCKKIELKNKLTPYTLNTIYNISLNNIEITIKGYDKLMRILAKCNPYFTQHHHENIKFEVSKINLIIGYHNGWMMLTGLPTQKEKDKDKVQAKYSPTKNLSRFINYQAPRESKQVRKNLSLAVQSSATHNIFNMLKFGSIQGQQNASAKSITLKVQQMNERTGKIRDGANIQYFDEQKGQLVAILQYVIKFSFNSTIREEKLMKFNLFWVPITFNTAEPLSQVRIPMIEHIELPGYPISWNKLIEQNKQISCEVGYRCVNENPQLHRNSKKERINSYTSITKTRLHSQNFGKENSFYDILMQQLQKDKDSVKVQQKNMLKTQSNIKSITQTSLLKEEQIIVNIKKMLTVLQKSMKPKLRLSANQNKNSIEKLIPPQTNDRVLKGINLVSKSYRLSIRLREYLPVTDNPSLYYIPRKLLLKLYAFRREFEQVVHINKDCVKSGIPILLQNPSKLDYQGFTFDFDLDNITQDEAAAYENGNNIVLLVHDLENMQFYASGSYPSIRLFINQGQIGEQKQSVQSEKNYRFFKIQLKSKSSRGKSDIRGCLLLESSLTKKTNNELTNKNKVDNEIGMEKLIKQIGTKQRQLLRIQAYTGNEGANKTKRQLIDKYKSSSHQQFVNEVTKKELNNDLQIDYQIGKVSFGWVKLTNTDQSQNNIFTFYLHCDFIQLVTDRSTYQKNALIAAKSEQNGKWKNYPNLSYLLGKQASNGYYEGKIPYGTEVDLLIKVTNNEWTQTCPETTIANIEVRRNTMTYKNIKIRLNLKKPLIDSAYHIDAMCGISQNVLKVKIPDQIRDEEGEFINSLSMSTSYNPKEDTVNLTKINQESVNETGLLMKVLLGVYSDKNYSTLKKTILLQIQCLQGQKLKLSLGELRCVKMPMLGTKLKPSQKIYRIETSNDEYRLNWESFQRLNYFSEIQKNQPQLILRCLRPVKDQLVVSIINLEDRLIKKYLVSLQCSLPLRCYLEQIELEGFNGEKLLFILKNPYHVDYGFYLSTTSKSIAFHDIEFQKQSADHQFVFRLRANGQVRVTAEIIERLGIQEYVLLCDVMHRVVSIFLLKTKDRLDKEKKLLSRFIQDNIIENQESISDAPAFKKMAYEKQYHI